MHMSHGGKTTVKMLLKWCCASEVKQKESRQKTEETRTCMILSKGLTLANQTHGCLWHFCKGILLCFVQKTRTSCKVLMTSINWAHSALKAPVCFQALFGGKQLLRCQGKCHRVMKKLLCTMKESCVPPGHQATTFNGQVRITSHLYFDGMKPLSVDIIKFVFFIAMWLQSIAVYYIWKVSDGVKSPFDLSLLWIREKGTGCSWGPGKLWYPTPPA